MKKMLRGMILTLAIWAPIASATVVDSVNETIAPYAGIEWNAREVGWFYTPTFSYTLTGIMTKFASGDERTVIGAIYTGAPASGGSLLRHAGFTPLSNEFSGATFDGLDLTAGTQYFFGFINVGDLGVNVTYEEGHTMLAPGIQYGFTGTLDRATFDSGPYLGVHAQPIVQFLSDSTAIPEPGSIALLVIGIIAICVRPNKLRPKVLA